MMNFQKTLLCKAVFGIGVDCFDGVESDDTKPKAARLSAEEEALLEFYKAQKVARVGRPHSYYKQDSMFHELAVCAMILDCYDRFLLYPVLGDPHPSKARNRGPT